MEEQLEFIKNKIGEQARFTCVTASGVSQITETMEKAFILKDMIIVKFKESGFMVNAEIVYQKIEDSWSPILSSFKSNT